MRRPPTLPPAAPPPEEREPRRPARDRAARSDTTRLDASAGASRDADVIPLGQHEGRTATATLAPPRPRHDEDAAEAARAELDAIRQLRRAERKRRRYERGEARRFTERARRQRRILIGGLAAFGAMVLLVVMLAYSPILAVRTIQISGAHAVDAGAVTQALSGQVGRPLSLIDYGDIDRTLAGFPLIASYVTESVPPDTLVIKIVERQPLVAVAAPNGFALVDAAGVTISTSAERPAGYALFDTSSAPLGSPGFASAAAAMKAIPPALLARVDSVQAPTADSVTFTMAGDGRRVVWGSPDQSALKAQILDKLLSQGAVQGSEYDVSSPQSPVVR